MLSPHYPQCPQTYTQMFCEYLVDYPQNLNNAPTSSTIYPLFHKTKSLCPLILRVFSSFCENMSPFPQNNESPSLYSQRFCFHPTSLWEQNSSSTSPLLPSGNRNPLRLPSGNRALLQLPPGTKISFGKWLAPSPERGETADCFPTKKESMISSSRRENE